MKELTIEQKAESYDKAIKVIKDNLDALNEIIETGVEIVNLQSIKNCFYRAFPELKENKQQSKSALEAIKEETEPKILGIDVEHSSGVLKECIDKVTLNSKEEKEPICYKCKKENSFHYCQYIKALGRCVIEHEKPANIVKPKFKEGNWVIFNDKHQSIYQIEKIENEYYILRHTHGGTFRVCILHDESLRLWTIQDVKDGDILAAENKDFMTPFVAIYSNLDNTIFKGLNNITFSSYCFVGLNGQFHKGENGHIIEDIYPATKEQRDFLFKKMNEAGYEWDYNKKELKKIEEKSTALSIEDENLFYFLRICVCHYINDANWVYEKREKASKEIILFIEKLKALYHNEKFKEASTKRKSNFENNILTDINGLIYEKI